MSRLAPLDLAALSELRKGDLIEVYFENGQIMAQYFCQKHKKSPIPGGLLTPDFPLAIGHEPRSYNWIKIHSADQTSCTPHGIVRGYVMILPASSREQIEAPSSLETQAKTSSQR